MKPFSCFRLLLPSMDELEDTSVIFKPKRQTTSNVSSGTTSEDGDYKALNAKRKVG